MLQRDIINQLLAKMSDQRLQELFRPVGLKAHKLFAHVPHMFPFYTQFPRQLVGLKPALAKILVVHVISGFSYWSF